MCTIFNIAYRYTMAAKKEASLYILKYEVY